MATILIVDDEPDIRVLIRLIFESAGHKVMEARHGAAGLKSRAVLHEALTEAVRWGLVARNVAGLVRPPQKPAHEMRTLTQPQVEALFRAAAGDRLVA